MDLMSFFFKKLDTGEKVGEVFFDQDAITDITPRPDTDRQIFGESRWIPGDRISYHTAYAVWQHRDPGNHEYLNAVRLVIQHVGEVPIQVNDRGMLEIQPQGTAPYPYEKDLPLRPVLKDFPINEMIFSHQRNGVSVSKARQQPLLGFVLPNTDSLTWFYQGGGEWIAEDKVDGPILRAIATTLHHRYEILVPGMPGNRFPYSIYESVVTTGELPNWYP